MSLILDALKKSEQERQAAPAAASRPAARPTRSLAAARWPWIAGIGVSFIVAVGFWLVFGSGPSTDRQAADIQPEPVREAAPVVGAKPQAVPVGPVDPPGLPRAAVVGAEQGRDAEIETGDAPRAEDQPAEGGASTDAMSVTRTEAPPERSDAAAVPAPEAVDQEPGAREAVVETPPAEQESLPLATSESPALGSTPDPVEGREPPVADLRASAKSGEASLPEVFSGLSYDLRKAVSPLELQVHVYDDDPERRFVMLNGKMLIEGEDVKPGLRIEQIVREGLVLSWQHRRFLFTPAD